MPKGRVDPTRLVAPYPTLPLELRRRKLKAHEMQAELDNKNAELKQKDALIKKQQDEPIQKTRLVQQLQSASLSIDQAVNQAKSEAKREIVQAMEYPNLDRIIDETQEARKALKEGNNRSFEVKVGRVSQEVYERMQESVDDGFLPLSAVASFFGQRLDKPLRHNAKLCLAKGDVVADNVRSEAHWLLQDEQDRQEENH